MGARQSRRSVDITTTPKKGEETAAAGEGEGKLEKIAEPDLKITTNGTLHNTAEIEFADKEEIAKDQIPEEKDQCDPELKENGIPEAVEVTEHNGPQEKDQPEQVVSQSQETTNSQEKTPESNECKTEEVADAKKVKKEKKKKWSFRSISFSKKDKSKPNKDTEKNGEVKEVAEEAAAENKTPVQSPVEENPKPTESTEAAAVAEPPAEPVLEKTVEAQKPAEEAPQPIAEEVPAAKEEATPVAEEPVKPVEEPLKSVEEPPKEEVASTPVAGEVPLKEPEPVIDQPAEPAPTKEPEETAQPVQEPPSAEETEVRTTQEVPPPLPSSNPPSPVTVFAESTKADALPADQVPSQESGVVEVPSSIQETGSAGIVEPVLSVGDTLVEQAKVVNSSEEIGGNASDASVITQVKQEELAQVPVVEPSPPVVASVEPFANVEEVPEPKETEVVLETTPKPSEPVEEKIITPPAPEEVSCPLPTSTEPKIEPLTPPSTPADVSEPVSQPAEVESLKVSCPLPKSTEPKIEPLSPQSTPAAVSEPVSKPAEVESLSDLPPPPVTSSELVMEGEKPVIDKTPVSEPEPPPAVDFLVESSEPEQAASDAAPKDVDSLAESTEPLPDPSSVASELVLRGDSLPDISTESLPSLPEPVSEGLPEPMSLPPVDSVPEPIASESENLPEVPPVAAQPTPVSSSSVPQDESPRPVTVEDTPVVLTNGNATNGLPTSPSDEVVESPVVPAPLKQVASDVTKDSEVKEAGDKPSEKVAETAAVEE